MRKSPSGKDHREFSRILKILIYAYFCKNTNVFIEMSAYICMNVYKAITCIPMISVLYYMKTYYNHSFKGTSIVAGYTIWF